MEAASPSIVRCVLDRQADVPGKTWCGRSATAFDRPFPGVDDAAFAARAGGAIVVCDGCEAEIVGAFVRAHATATS